MKPSIIVLVEIRATLFFLFFLFLLLILLRLRLFLLHQIHANALTSSFICYITLHTLHFCPASMLLNFYFTVFEPNFCVFFSSKDLIYYYYYFCCCCWSYYYVIVVDAVQYALWWFSFTFIFLLYKVNLRKIK